MSRFSSLLNSINDRLDVPQPAKSRILIEIAADLDDAYDYYIKQGKTDIEATQLAQEKFVLDETVITELAAIHQPFLRKWMDRLSMNVQSRWERIVLVLALLTIAVLSGRIMLTNSFFENSSPFVWPIWGITLAGFVLFFIKFYKLYLIKDHKTTSLRHGINIVAYFGAFSLALGFTGYFYELMHYGVETVYPGGSLITVICTVTDSPSRIQNIYTSFVTSATVMMASLISTMFLALFWYILNSKAARIEMAEAVSLLAP